MSNNTTTQKRSGNKCGHNPKAPRRFQPPQHHAPHPKLLEVSIILVFVYTSNPDLFPGLNAANGSTRQQRSERREACVLMLCCILHYTDIATLLVGIPQHNGSMKGLTMDYLAELTGLSLRRAERAMHDLKQAGFIKVFSICEKITDTVYKGVAAIRSVNKALFTVLGKAGWLEHEQRRANEKKAKKEAKRARKEQANISMAMGAQHGKAAPPETPASNGRRGEMSPIADFLSSARAILNANTS
jgi:hypothetical protein